MRQQVICTVLALLLLPSWGLAADDQKSQPDGKAAEGRVFGDIQARTNGDPVLVTQSERYAQWDTRLGYWAFWSSGSPSKVGEYQSLSPSPFWDVDGFSSNGTRTLAVTATGTDQETTVGKIYYYQPGLTAKADYDRFIHRLDHDPIGNIPNSNSFSGNPADPLIVKQDLNFGKDYAIRVQELNASIKGIIADDNVKVRLDIWGMKKDGTRQVSAVAKCYSQSTTVPPDHPPVDNYSGSRCHVLSQSQQIDWTTTEIKPVAELRLTDSITMEYSRPMRNFTSNDSITSRFYDGTGRLTYNAGNNMNPYAYDVVPGSYTQMDQLKINGDITEDNKAYAFLMAGNTLDREIGMQRWFNNMDVRVTNTSLENLTLTGYGKVFNEAESMPDLANVTAVNQGPTTALGTNKRPLSSDVASALTHPINYHKSTAGLKGVWRPNGGGYSTKGLALVGGYEYTDLEREYAVHQVLYPTTGVFNQPRTIYNNFEVGPDYRWSSTLDTYVRYKYQNAEQPLTAVQPWAGAYNSSLPRQENIVEIGFNWVPSDWFVCNATIGIEKAQNHSRYGNYDAAAVDFDEESYPMSFSVWYAASDRVSFSAGYAVYSNYVAQGITLADQLKTGTGAPPVTGQWNYGAQAHVVTFGSRYAATERLSLTGQVEWVRGNNSVNNSTMTFTTAPTTVTDLGSYSRVTNETTRLSVGADWTVRSRVVVYTRYELYNFIDMNAASPGSQTGLAQGVLGGLSAMF